MGVSHKEGVHIVKQTIYNHAHADGTSKLALRLPHELKYTRRTRCQRITKAASIASCTSIHDLPKKADGRRLGDWETDTIVDFYGQAIVTLTERSTNFIMKERLPQGHEAFPCVRTVVRSSHTGSLSKPSPPTTAASSSHI